jgi:hypothetical protein
VAGHSRSTTEVNPSFARTASLAWKLVYWSLILVLSLLVFVLFLRTSGIGINGKATFEKVLTGTAYRPYIYRQLLPAVANLAAPLIDGPAALRLGRRLEDVLGERFFRARLNGRLFPSQVVLLLAMMYLSLVGFAVTTWFFLRDLGYRRSVRYLMPPAMLLASTVFFGFGYMYDFALLFLFTMGLWLMYRQSWAAYLLVFAVGTLNKETTVFLGLIFVVYFWSRLARPRFLGVGAAQLGIYALIQGFLRYRFRNNPGDHVEWHLPDQIAAFQHIGANTPWLLIIWASTIAGIAILVIHKWRRKPAFLRASLAILPFFLVLFIFFAWPLEIRDLLEVFPVIAILILPPPAEAPEGALPVSGPPPERLHSPS